MLKTHIALVALAALTFIACSDKTQINVDHTLQPTPPAPKPTGDCSSADMAVYQILKTAQKPGFDTTQPVILNDDVSCAVHVMFDDKVTQAEITDLANAYQALAKSYAFNLYNKSEIPLWYDMPAAAEPSMPSDDDCKNAQGVVATAFPRAKVTVVTNPRNPHTPTRCYVQAMFPDEASFKSFVTYAYPANSGQSDPFHVYRTVAEKTVHAVSVFGTETP